MDDPSEEVLDDQLPSRHERRPFASLDRSSSRASRSRHDIKRLVKKMLTNPLKPNNNNNNNNNKQSSFSIRTRHSQEPSYYPTHTTETKMRRSKSFDDHIIQPHHPQLTTISKTRSLNSLTSLPTNSSSSPHPSTLPATDQHITTSQKKTQVLPQLYLPHNKPTTPNIRSNQTRRATLHARPVPKLRDRTSTPLFQILADDPKQEEEKFTSSRPASSLSHASNHSLIKRIKAGITPKTSLTSPSPVERSFIAGLARSTLSFTTTETMGSNNTHRPSLSRPSIGPSRSSTDVKESLNHRPVVPLYRSQSDSVSQQRSNVEELLTNTTTNNNNNNKVSPRKHSTNSSSNYSLGISSIPQEQTRETSYHYRNSQQPKKIRKPMTSSGFRSQPVIEVAKKIHPDKIPQVEDPGPEIKLKPLERSPEDETEEAYLVRLGEKIEKSKIPSVLASSPNPFHSSALTKYMSTFEFSHDPIDLSIRKLLMVVDLPSETQQIDRVMESFSKRYMECNPKLFDSHDQVYILAFSIIMLHTDAFNKSNKSKMTRADYVKNTKMDGIPTELLEYIYDNVTYTPFVYVDPERDITGQKISGHSQQTSDHTGSSFFGLGGNSSNTNNNPASSTTSSSILSGTKDSKSKLDPYQLIAKGSTHELRLDLGAVIPSRNPFSFTGSVSWFDFKRLRESFNPAKSVMIQVVNLAPAKTHSIMRLIETDDFVEPGNYYSQEHSPPTYHHSSLKRTGDDGSWNESKSSSPATTSPFTAGGFLNLRAIKVGLAHLKIDAYTTFTTPQSNSPQNSINEVSMSKNVISKKWRLFCILLTARQLILLKDVGLATELQESIKLAGSRNRANPEDQLVVRITGLKPDLVLSLDDGVALMDSAYQRRPCTFRLILSKDLSLLMGVDDADDMNSWITHINYAAAYKTHRLPFWPMSSPPPSMSMSPSTTANHHKVYLRATLNPNSRNEMSSESLLSSSSSFNRKNQHPRDNDEISSARPSIDRSMASRSTSTSHSLAARPFDIGPSFIGESPRSSSVHSRVSVTTNPLPTHWDRVKAQILILEAQIVAAKTELNDNLRLARNLAVLTPFQLSTRSRLQQSIMPVANRVRNSRCELSKLVCYREVLMRDLALGIAAMNGTAKTSTPSGPSGVHETSSTVDHEPASRSTSQRGSRAAQGVDQPQEILIQNTTRTSQDDGHHSRRGASFDAVRRRSSTPRRASDIFSGSRTGRHTSQGSYPSVVDSPLIRHSPIPPSSPEKSHHRRSLSGFLPTHTAQVSTHLKDSATKRPEDTASFSSPKVKPAGRPSTGGYWTSEKRGSVEEDDWEGMASLRKVGRHADDGKGLAGGPVMQEQAERSGRAVGSQDMLPVSSSSWRLTRPRSVTSTSTRSLVIGAESPVVSAAVAVEPVMSESDRMAVPSSSRRPTSQAASVTGSLKRREVSGSPCAGGEVSTPTGSVGNPTLMPPPPPLGSPLFPSSSSSSSPSSSLCAPASARSAARARMLAKAKLIATATASSSSALSAVFARPTPRASPILGPPAAAGIPATADSPRCNPPSTPRPNPSLAPSLAPSAFSPDPLVPPPTLKPSSPLPTAHSSALTDSTRTDSSRTDSSLPDSNFVLRHGKRFTQAWGLP